MKRFFSVVLVLCLLLCSVSALAQTAFTPGVYTGQAQGKMGLVTVEVTLTEDAVESVAVVSHEETAGLSDPAIESIPAAIVENQSLAVDTVAGATMTSEAIIAAVADCIKQAGGDVDALQTVVEKEKVAGEKVTVETPVVVVGAGGAGLAAAVKLGQLGMKCVVIEKMPVIGGNTIRCGAAYNAVDPELQAAQGIEDSIELHIQQTYDGGDRVGNLELITVLCENALDSIHWLEDLGCEFKQTITTVIGATWPRTHYPVNSIGSDFILPLEAACEEMGQEIIVNMEAKELIVSDGRVVGVLAEDTATGTPYEFRAEKGVILATGGFAADIERCRSYNPNIPEDITTSNHPGATGDGIDMAVAIGAATEGIEYVQMLPITGNCVSTAIENQIFVNVEGNRFVREDGRRDVMSNAILEQPEKYMYMIGDQRVADESITGSNIDALLEAGKIYRGDTLEELAEQIGVNAENLVKTVEAFNELVKGNGEDEFGRAVYDHTIEVGPFWASAKQRPCLHHTMGGVKIDVDARVIDTNGEAIPGLYAAGEVCGGIHGSNRLGGNACADIFVFGRIAAQSAFEEK